MKENIPCVSEFIELFDTGLRAYTGTSRAFNSFLSMALKISGGNQCCWNYTLFTSRDSSKAFFFMNEQYMFMIYLFDCDNRPGNLQPQVHFLSLGRRTTSELRALLHTLIRTAGQLPYKRISHFSLHQIFFCNVDIEYYCQKIDFVLGKMFGSHFDIKKARFFHMCLDQSGWPIETTEFIISINLLVFRKHSSLSMLLFPLK